MADYNEYNPNAHKNQAVTGSVISTGTGVAFDGRLTGVTKRTVRTVKTYDEEGRLTQEEIIEELTYGNGYYQQAPWQYPLISNGLTTEYDHQGGYPK